MKVAVTGAHGFLGWHLQAALLAHGQHEVVPIGREAFSGVPQMAASISGCDAVVHLAGVNRGPDHEVEEGNRSLAETLASALAGSQVRVVVFGNSIHQGANSGFGRGKAYASEHLAAACRQSGAAYADVILPNIFGEGGRPNYNSFVATFCFELLAGREPTVVEDRQLRLLTAQDAADILIAAVERRETGELRPGGGETSVATVLESLRQMRDYPRTGDFPDLGSPFRVALFSTFQSFCFPQHFPIDRIVHSDPRGSLFEAARAQSTDSLSFVSTTVPGGIRGQHFHRRKIERFVVVDGEAEIRLRRVVTNEEVTFHVSGARPQVVDMPPLWAHSLRNPGAGSVTTVFWSNELLSAESPDTYRFDVY